MVRKIWLEAAIVGCLLIILAGLSLAESARESATADEVAHIPAGITYVSARDLRLNPEHPPLIKYLSGLSSQLFASPKWDKNSEAWQRASEWEFGRNLLYQTPANDPDKIIFWGRLPILFLSLGLGLIIFMWARTMFGRTPGLLALGLYALDPNIVAFSHLVSFDLPMTTFIALSAFGLWKAEATSKRWLYAVSGVALGLAVSAKVTAILFGLLLPILIFRLLLRKSPALKFRVRDYLIKLAIIYGAALAAVAVTYLVILGIPSWAHLKQVASEFGETLYFGLLQYQAHRPMYVAGRLYESGQWWYFPLSFLVKSPLPFLLLVITGLISSLTRWANWHPGVRRYLLLPLLVLGITIMSSASTIGLRYLFVIYPFLFILAGYILYRVAQSLGRRGATVLVGVCLLYYALAHTAFLSRQITYANQLAGSPATSYRYLADSSLDWGQGLIELQDFATAHQIADLPIIYFGEADPAYYGFRTLYRSIVFKPSVLDEVDAIQGWLAISASAANYLGLHQNAYELRGQEPVGVVAGSILIYFLR